jgi:hypothetical protein
MRSRSRLLNRMKRQTKHRIRDIILGRAQQRRIMSDGHYARQPLSRVKIGKVLTDRGLARG